MTPKHWQILTDTGLDASALSAPLRARHPWHYRVMGDLFATLSFSDIAAVLGVVAASPRHEFEISTNYPERMGEWFAWFWSEERDMCGMTVSALRAGGYDNIGDGTPFDVDIDPLQYQRRDPFANLRILTNVTTQAEAEQLATARAALVAKYKLNVRPDGDEERFSNEAR